MAAFAACGNTINGSSDDTSSTVDALGGNGSGSGAGLTADTITCQARTRTIANSNGTKSVTATYFALVSGISPTSDYYVEMCDYGQPAAPTTCPTGSTCTDTGPAPPAAADTCGWTFRNGSFANGQLYIYCGFTQTIYDASNNVTSDLDYRYHTVRLHH